MRITVVALRVRRGLHVRVGREETPRLRVVQAGVHVDQPVLRQVLVAGVAAPEHQLRLLAGSVISACFRVEPAAPRVVAVLGLHGTAPDRNEQDAALVVADEVVERPQTYMLPNITHANIPTMRNTIPQPRFFFCLASSSFQRKSNAEIGILEYLRKSKPSIMK